jgi:hypothetical protein
VTFRSSGIGAIACFGGPRSTTENCNHFDLTLQCTADGSYTDEGQPARKIPAAAAARHRDTHAGATHAVGRVLWLLASTVISSSPARLGVAVSILSVTRSLLLPLNSKLRCCASAAAAQQVLTLYAQAVATAAGTI